MNEELILIKKYASDILNSEKFMSQKNYIQHGKTSVYTHELNVTKYALKIVKKFRIKVDEKTLIRGCLLHDYFLYDWHIPNEINTGLHGFHHAKIAMMNASRDFELNEKEKSMIYTHMFPLNFRLPKYKESVILCISDKIVAIIETIKRN